MFLLIREDKDNGNDYFGPFPTEDRAKRYAESFEDRLGWTIVPLIVPNCVQVKLVY